MPEPTRKRVADAHENGGWCELRVGVLNEAATVRLVLCNVDGRVVELMKVDHLPY